MTSHRFAPWLLAVLSTAAHAEDLPSDAELLDAKVVAVERASLTGQDGAAAGAALAAVLAVPATAAQRATLAALALPLPAEEPGFGFQGASDAGDVVALQTGYVLGRIASHAAAGDVGSIRALARWADARASALDFLSEPVTDAISPFVAEALEGRVEVARLVAVLQATERGLGGPEIRGHGYLAAGIWAGMALVGSTTDTGRANLLAVGQGLITALEQDAAYDASDTAIATQLKAISAELSSDAPRPAVVSEAGRALMAITADSEL